MGRILGLQVHIEGVRRICWQTDMHLDVMHGRRDEVFRRKKSSSKLTETSTMLLTNMEFSHDGSFVSDMSQTMSTCQRSCQQMAKSSEICKLMYSDMKAIE